MVGSSLNTDLNCSLSVKMCSDGGHGNETVRIREENCFRAIAAIKWRARNGSQMRGSGMKRATRKNTKTTHFAKKNAETKFLIWSDSNYLFWLHLVTIWVIQALSSFCQRFFRQFNWLSPNFAPCKCIFPDKTSQSIQRRLIRTTDGRVDRESERAIDTVTTQK